MGANKFNFTDEEFLNVINLLCKLDLDEEEYTPLTSMDAHLNMEQLDSLSMTVFFIWIVHLFGIPEAIMREFVSKGVFTIKAIKEFVILEATQTYSYAEAQKYTKKDAGYFGSNLAK